MHWTTIILSMAASACFTLGAVHLLVWLRMRDSSPQALFSVAAFGAGVLALLELSLIHSVTPREYGFLLSWAHVPLAVLVVSLAWFIHLHFAGGHRWLVWTITGLRAILLAINFLVEPNATFQELTGLRTEHFLGTEVAVPVGTSSPFRILADLSVVLLLVLVVEAAVSARRAGRGRRAGILGGIIFLAILLAGVNSALMTRGVLPAAFVSLNFLMIVIAMGIEVGIDLARGRIAARELRDSEERIRLAAHAAGLQFWELDYDGFRVWSSGDGSSPAQPVRRGELDGFLETVHDEDRDRVRRAIRAALESAAQTSTEFRVARPDGSIGWIAVHGRAEQSGRKSSGRMRGVSRDVTRRKISELALEDQRLQLIHLQRAFAAEQLSSALVHEIMQPLAVILRNAEAGELLLQREPLDVAELRDILREIREDEQRTVDIIQRLKSLLRRHEVRLEPLEVADLIAEVGSMIGSAMQARRTTLNVEIPPDLPRIRGDRIHLQQVILNLLLNSLDALTEIGDGPGEILVRASSVDAGMVELAVTDHGPGIPPDRLPGIFEPLVTTKANGLGIGLSICRTIIALHGGRVRGENNPEGGATFRITLPVAESGNP